MRVKTTVLSAWMVVAVATGAAAVLAAEPGTIDALDTESVVLPPPSAGEVVISDEKTAWDEGGCDPAAPISGFGVRGFVVGVDYLLLRPSFSNNTAFYRATARDGDSISLTPVNYDFGFSSGVRGFIGYNLSDDTLVRFGYLAIDSSVTIDRAAEGNYAGGDGVAYIGPFFTEAFVPGSTIRSVAGVELDVYDLELARRFELDADVAGAAAWDTAASVGIRFADASVDSTITNLCPQCPDSFVTTDRTFNGVGPRLAAQGRRYLGAARRWSVFANGGVALLVGDVTNVDRRITVEEPLSESQKVDGTIVVPNVDISLGASWQLADRTSLSAGWMLMYWGNLGYSETIDTGGVGETALATSVPLTNSSLTYDGFFLRLTHCF